MAIEKKQKRLRVPLHRYFMMNFIVTLGMACALACAIVCSGFLVFYHGPLTGGVVICLCILVCVLIGIFGSLFMWLSSRRIVDPILRLGEGLRQVTQGDFTIQVPRENPHTAKTKEVDRIKKSEHSSIMLLGKEGLCSQENDSCYENELDELIANFNRMSRELNHMDVLRKDFMSSVSHEFKTPITAIQGFTEMLLDDHLSEDDEREYLELVNEQSLRLSKLCDNMLNLTRLDHQEIVVRKDVIQVDEHLRKTIILMEEKWREKHVAVIPELEPHRIISNKDLLQQVYMNLLDNAIKYSHVNGRIYVKEWVKEDILHVTVEDEGIGIEEGKLPRIFDKFYQCEESHKQTGNGLGLPIVERIIDMLDGDIMCKSRIGEGTIFEIRIAVERI